MNKQELSASQLEEINQLIFQTARTSLYIHMRFLDVALSSFTFVPDSGTAVLGTDGVHIFYHPSWPGITYQQEPVRVNRAYFHSLLHCLFRHMVRPNRDDLLWNLACDIVVESITDSLYVKPLRLPQSWLRQETYRKLNNALPVLTPKSVRRELASWKLDEPALARLLLEFTIDDHQYWIGGDQPEKQANAQQKWEDLSEQIETDLETFSKESSADSKSLNTQLKIENKDHHNYRDFLRKFAVLREETSIDPDSFDYSFYSYGLQLYGNMPLIEPQEWRETIKIEEFAIIIDTSMSCSDELVTKFLEETYHILSEAESFFRKVNIHIIQCDEQIQSDFSIQKEADLRDYMTHLELKGKGGTDFRPAFAYMEELRSNGTFSNLKGLLYFTDGRGVYPSRMPGYQTVFVFMEPDYDDKDVPPWAIKLILDEDDFNQSK